MEAGREELHDVLEVPRVAQVLRHVHVQMICVRVDQARQHASACGDEVEPRAAQSGLAAGGVRREEHLQELAAAVGADHQRRSEEHTSELQSQSNLVCRLLLEKKKTSRT